MLRAILAWVERRRAIRRRWREDARRLVRLHGPTAYYEAQRLAATSRAIEDGQFLHWAKVAAEVARIEPSAEMDIDVVRSIVDHELRHRVHSDPEP
ncbi:hypothetical protein HED50_23620 [Ochrobactrum oryzae]|jgi:hypothetical protein|uniref:hypothetical protein n=1 Tax=Brucella oryzae TaxID=335286 RepID=UPI000B82D0D0|nr:hypothetical protein [Brucella oryzae]